MVKFLNNELYLKYYPIATEKQREDFIRNEYLKLCRFLVKSSNILRKYARVYGNEFDTDIYFDSSDLSRGFDSLLNKTMSCRRVTLSIDELKVTLSIDELNFILKCMNKTKQRVIIRALISIMLVIILGIIFCILH